MNATTLFRIAAILFLSFAVGHTFGFLSFKPPTPEGLQVMDAMNRVHFTLNNSTFSYGGFYKGFGLSITVSQIFSCLVAWHLGKLAKTAPQQVGFLAWALCATQVIGGVLSLLYFAAVPALLSAVLALVLGWAALLVGKTVVPAL